MNLTTGIVDISESRTSLTGGLNFESNEELGENIHLWTGTSLSSALCLEQCKQSVSLSQ